ncbi:TAXI family TRAP transporter solute-binding subunit [Marinomonas primoryensis]|uniref:TAXI family TRAP transporter solute receptor n=1 Tax=Marinomonas primoryensis TaxID=178399 RepID=A0A859CWE6_9GAMM|nr:TAXI family TRAP transporter solute-binding subunit [Marinomonas primoryensis]QKK80983.1 TAXI family TRAP transporter solute receptor [Marinomonas primoryensis]
MKKLLLPLITACSITLISANASAQILSIASPPQGSVWNTMSNGIANVGRSKANINLVVQPYSGNRAMMDAVNQGLAEFAINDVNDAIVAVQGVADYKGKKRSHLRVALRISPQPIGIFVRQDSGINRIEDLKGKRVASGWNAFPIGRPHMEAMLATGGLTWDDVKNIPVPDLIRAADNLSSGRLDATYFAVGGPKVAEVDASVGGVKFLPVKADQSALNAVLKIRPAFYFSEVKPAPHLVGIDKPTQMLTWDNVLIVNDKVSDENVYQLVKAILENKEALIQIFPGFKALAVNTPNKNYPGIQYHPGAVRYFKEKGLWEK